MPDNQGDHKLTFKAELELEAKKVQSTFDKVKTMASSAFSQMEKVANKAYSSMSDDGKRTADVIKDMFKFTSFKEYFRGLKTGFNEVSNTIQAASKQSEMSAKQAEAELDRLLDKVAKNRIRFTELQDRQKELSNIDLKGKSDSYVRTITGEILRNEREMNSIKEDDLKLRRAIDETLALTNRKEDNEVKLIQLQQYELSKLLTRQKELEKEGNTWGNPEYDRNYQRINQIKKDINDYRKSLENADDAQNKMASSAQSMSFQNLMARFRALVGLLSQLKTQAIHAASALVSLTKKMWDFASSLRSPKEFIHKILPRMPSLFNRTSRSIKSTHIPLKRMVNLFVKYVFGIRSIFFLYRRIRKSVGEGLQSLAIVDSTTNQSISNFLTALNTLKGSLASAFSPIINVIAPILTKFINLLATATNYVGMFLAYLTGRKTYYKAIGIQQDYAGALNDTADAAGNASDAMQDYLSGLDEIRKFDDGTGSGSGGGGGGGAGADIMKGINWEEVEIPSKIKNIVDTLKDYVKDQDWEGLGEYMASGINKGFEKLYKVVSWDNIGPKIVPVIDAITHTFNSLVDNIDWDLIGRTVGAGVNTLVNSANRFLTGINWKNLGASFAEGINGLVDEVEWNNVGELLANKIMWLWETFNGFVHELHWDAIGTAIGDAINGFFKRYNFSTIADTIATFLNGLFTTLKNAALTIQWGDIVTNITNGINTFIRNFRWRENGQALNTFLQNLATAISDFAKNTNWKGIGEGIAGFLSQIEWIPLIKNVVSAIMHALIGIIQGLASEPEGIALIAAIAGWFTVTNVLPIANAIAAAFGAPTITKIIGGAIAKAMGGGAAGAAAGGAAAGAGGASAGAASAGIAGGIGLSATAGLAAALLGAGLVIAVDTAMIYAGHKAKLEWGTQDTQGLVDKSESLGGSGTTNRSAVAVKTEATEKLTEATERLNVAENDLTVTWEYGDGQMIDYTYDMDINRKKTKDLQKSIENADKALQAEKDRKYLVDVDIQKGELLKKHGSAEQFVKDLDTNSLIDEKIELKKTGKFAQTKTAEGFVKANSGGTYGAPMDLLKSGEFAKTKTAAGFVAAYAGGTYQAPTDLKKAGQFAEKGTVAGFVSTYAGGTVNKGIDAVKAGNLAKYGTVGNLVNSLYSGPGAFKDVYLQRYGWTTVSGYVNNYMGGGVTTPVYLALQNAWSVATSFAQTVRTAFGNMFGIRLASGGILPFATGGIIKSTGNILSMIPHYASGTSRAHGSLFVAGEAGPEIIGHINGQTEILNKSQIATAIYAAVTNGIASVLERFGTALFSQLNLNTNAVIGALRYSGFSSMQIPAIASGTVVPRNSQFLASFGATSESGNISESALRQIIREENSNNSYQFVAQLNRKTIFSEVIKEAKLQQLQSGKNPFELA